MRPLAEVSVVIAAYNQASWLAQAIDSVRAQTFADWELVIVDDGSTDDTPAVVARAEDARIVYVRQARAERAAARNRGIAASTGRLVAFLDADDLWRPEKLARQVAALAADPAAGLCYTIARFIDAAGRPLPLRKPPRALASDAAFSQSWSARTVRWETRVRRAVSASAYHRSTTMRAPVRTRSQPVFAPWRR